MKQLNLGQLASIKCSRNLQTVPRRYEFTRTEEQTTASQRGSQCYEWEVASVEDSHCLVAGVTPPGSQCRGVAGVAFPYFQYK